MYIACAIFGRAYLVVSCSARSDDTTKNGGKGHFVTRDEPLILLTLLWRRAMLEDKDKVYFVIL